MLCLNQDLSYPLYAPGLYLSLVIPARNYFYKAHTSFLHIKQTSVSKCLPQFTMDAYHSYKFTVSEMQHLIAPQKLEMRCLIHF